VLSGVEKVRLYDLNWLLVAPMSSASFFHADKFLPFGDWRGLNAAWRLASTLHISFFTQWMLLLSFVLSGASITVVLQHRSAGEFIRECSLRILLPLVVLE